MSEWAEKLTDKLQGVNGLYEKLKSDGEDNLASQLKAISALATSCVELRAIAEINKQDGAKQSCERSARNLLRALESLEDSLNVPNQNLVGAFGNAIHEFADEVVLPQVKEASKTVGKALIKRAISEVTKGLL